MLLGLLSHLAGSARTAGERFTSQASAGELGPAKHVGSRSALYAGAWGWGGMYLGSLSSPNNLQCV
jgi:hypothetical protein